MVSILNVLVVLLLLPVTTWNTTYRWHSPCHHLCSHAFWYFRPVSYICFHFSITAFSLYLLKLIDANRFWFWTSTGIHFFKIRNQDGGNFTTVNSDNTHYIAHELNTADRHHKPEQLFMQPQNSKIPISVTIYLKFDQNHFENPK